MTNLTQCAECGVAASLKCGGCKRIVYCGKEHQKLHWKKGHKQQCKCYEVACNELLGRHLRATRDIKPGEIILREPPLLYGPKVASTPLCLGCHRTLAEPPLMAQRNYYKCGGCGWPLCGRDCERSPLHAAECALMASRKFRAKIDYETGSEGKKESAYCVILPLRCMLLKRSNAAAYERFAALEDHLAERIETPLYKVLSANLVTFVRTIMGLDEWPEAEVLRVAARLDTNAFDVRQRAQQRHVRAIYPAAAMLSHDCVPNVRHTFDEQMQIVFIAKTAIAKSEIIATSYTQPLKSTLMRRLHLRQAKCFDCTCRRCRDPMELGTFAGAILCCKCKVGKIISTDPMNDAAPWRCQLCPHEISAKQYNLGNIAMEREIATLNRSAPYQFEEFLHRYRDTLHECNTHMLQVKYALTQLYGNVPGFFMDEMNDAALNRKVELCRELLDIAELLDNGRSLFRGNLLLDLQEAVVVQAKRKLFNGLLTRKETQELFMDAKTLLSEAVEILQLEPGMQSILKERTDSLAEELEK